MSTATPFPFDPPPGANSAAPGANAATRASKPGTQGAGDGESDFTRSLLEVQEHETAGGETARIANAQAANTQAVAATENGGAPHEVSQFLARLFAGEHPDQPALGKTVAAGLNGTGEAMGEGEAVPGLQPEAQAGADILPDTEIPGETTAGGKTKDSDSEASAPVASGEPATDAAILAAALAEGENGAAPPQPGQAATQENAIETLANEAETATAPLSDGETAGADKNAGETGQAAASDSADNGTAGTAAAIYGETALNSAPQSEAARARNAAHLPPLPENANARAQAMARPQFDAEAGDTPSTEGADKGKRAEGADAAAANAAARRNEAATRPAPPAPQAAAPQPAAPPATAIEGQAGDDAALAGTGGAQPQGQSAQAGTATQLASQYSPTAALPLAQLAVQIASRHRAGHSRFEIRIDPPELGRIDVRLDMGQDGSVTTRMVVERAETLDLLQRDARALERALGEAGLDAQEGSLQFSLKDEGFGRQQAGGGEPGTAAGTEAASELSGERRMGESHYRPAFASDRALDIRV